MHEYISEGRYKKAKCLLLYIPLHHIIFLYDPFTVQCPINRFPKQIFPRKFINYENIICNSKCIWSVELYGSDIWTVGRNYDRVVNAFVTWSWRRMLKIRWADRVTNDNVFQRAKEKRLVLKIKKIDASNGEGIQLGRQGIQLGRYGIHLRRQGIQLGRQGIQLGRYGIQLGRYGIQLGRYGIQLGRKGIQLGRQGIQSGRQGIQ